jgi:hypothetical protein
MCSQINNFFHTQLALNKRYNVIMDILGSTRQFYLFVCLVLQTVQIFKL